MQTFLPLPDFVESAKCLDRRRLGNEAFHVSHRAALLAKDPAYYGQFEWIEEPKVQYLWPEGEMV